MVFNFGERAMFQGTVFFISPQGWSLCERDGDSVVIFVHPNQVVDHRRLHINDRISFTVIPGRIPGKTQAGDVRYISHAIARQTSGNGGVL
jgi:cold shock CspA family protein